MSKYGKKRKTKPIRRLDQGASVAAITLTVILSGEHYNYHGFSQDILDDLKIVILDDLKIVIFLSGII